MRTYEEIMTTLENLYSQLLNISPEKLAIIESDFERIKNEPLNPTAFSRRNKQKYNKKTGEIGELINQKKTLFLSNPLTNVMSEREVDNVGEEDNNQKDSSKPLPTNDDSEQKVDDLIGEFQEKNEELSEERKEIEVNVGVLEQLVNDITINNNLLVETAVQKNEPNQLDNSNKEENSQKTLVENLKDGQSENQEAVALQAITDEPNQLDNSNNKENSQKMLVENLKDGQSEKQEVVALQATTDEPNQLDNSNKEENSQKTLVDNSKDGQSEKQEAVALQKTTDEELKQDVNNLINENQSTKPLSGQSQDIKPQADNFEPSVDKSHQAINTTTNNNVPVEMEAPKNELNQLNNSETRKQTNQRKPIQISLTFSEMQNKLDTLYAQLNEAKTLEQLGELEAQYGIIKRTPHLYFNLEQTNHIDKINKTIAVAFSIKEILFEVNCYADSFTKKAIEFQKNQPPLTAIANICSSAAERFINLYQEHSTVEEIKTKMDKILEDTNKAIDIHINDQDSLQSTAATTTKNSQTNDQVTSFESTSSDNQEKREKNPLTLTEQVSEKLGYESIYTKLTNLIEELRGCKTKDALDGIEKRYDDIVNQDYKQLFLNTTEKNSLVDKQKELKILIAQKSQLLAEHEKLSINVNTQQTQQTQQGSSSSNTSKSNSLKTDKISSIDKHIKIFNDKVERFEKLYGKRSSIETDKAIIAAKDVVDKLTTLRNCLETSDWSSSKVVKEARKNLGTTITKAHETLDTHRGFKGVLLKLWSAIEKIFCSTPSDDKSTHYSFFRTNSAKDLDNAEKDIVLDTTSVMSHSK